MKLLSRREFLRGGLFGLAALGFIALPLPPPVAPSFPVAPPPPVAPIKESPVYQALGKKLTMQHELPQGALARYERDIAVRSYIIPKRG